LVALFGSPGSGKSTTSSLLEASARQYGWAFLRLKLADPLYDLQSLIYAMCGRPLHDRYAQDGELLGALGGQMRRIKPTILTDVVAAKLTAYLSTMSGSETQTFVVCDDMRPRDVPAMQQLGFRAVLVACPPEVARVRHRSRSDLSMAESVPAIEGGVGDVHADEVIDNCGDRAHLALEVEHFVKALIG
jgi:cytidine deaminase